MADIVVSSKKKINFFDRVIQSVVIMLNMNKMNKAIDEHLSVIRKTEGDDKKLYQENILREIVFVKYQYDIMQRSMYELKMSYPDDIIDNINSSDKTTRLELQKSFLEMEYDRVTRSKFKSKEEIKFNLLSISSAIDEVKQNIKDEGKAQRYNQVIKTAEDIDTAIQTEQYKDELYKELFKNIDEYVGYINDNYDISKLPSDERELIEYVIESMIRGIESDIDKHMYEYNLIINICKNSYRYFKIIDKIFAKILRIYDESYMSEIFNDDDYIKMFKEIYDMMIKTKVNDVHRTISTEDEYLEYSKMLAEEDSEEEINKFLFEKAKDLTDMEEVKEKIEAILHEDEEEIEELEDEDIDPEALNLDEVLGRTSSEENSDEDELDIEIDEEEQEENEEIIDIEDKEEAIEEEKPKRKVGRPRKEDKEEKPKRRVGRPKKNK
ncbi:MAG: hypothetical protein IJX34_04540 [Clostridia bacterium]|nr:hypothetical protein [Clostridia bacterium]